MSHDYAPYRRILRKAEFCLGVSEGNARNLHVLRYDRRLHYVRTSQLMLVCYSYASINMYLSKNECLIVSGQLLYKVLSGRSGHLSDRPFDVKLTR
jgi:hypothetical protein